VGIDPAAVHLCFGITAMNSMVVGEIFTGMPLRGYPHGLTRLVVFFSRFTVWKRQPQVLISEENDHASGQVVHRKFYVRADSDANYLKRLILEFRFECRWTSMRTVM